VAIQTETQEGVGHEAPELADHDVELLRVTNCQLRTFERLHLFASHYVSRIVDHVSFPTPGEQLCQREIHLTIPDLPGFSEQQRAGPFIVSLGEYRRRRLADIVVMDGRGTRLNLLSRRQHGYVIALALVRPHFTADEWQRLGQEKAFHISLNDLRIYLARVITAIVPNENYTADGAGELLGALLEAVGAEQARRTVEIASFRLRCDEALVTTRYLCWVDGTPGGIVQLRATYTQPESPQQTHEPDNLRSDRKADGRVLALVRRTRAVWRDSRNRMYTRARMMPVRYVFPTPGFVTMRSYYFLLTPPPETEIVLLDWDADHRYAPGQSGSRLTATTEVETAGWAYHFHNHRVAPRRRRRERRRFEHGTPIDRRVGLSDRRQDDRRRSLVASKEGMDRRVHGRRVMPPDRRQSQRRRERRHGDRRRLDARAGALVHAFVRGEQAENGKLIAIGLLSLGLAVLAAQGVLQTVASETANQILLLAPAALVLTVDHQARHHFAAITPVFRGILWAYIVLALIFATSIVVSMHAVPFVPTETTVLLPRIASGTFALASGLLALAFWWAGPHFAIANTRRYKRLIKRLRIFHTRSRVKAFIRYQRKPSYWRRRATLSDDELVGEPDHLNSHEAYAKLARHSADRVLIVIIAASAVAIYLMISQHWGQGEACAIRRVHAEQIATAERRPIVPGTCLGGHYVPGVWHAPVQHVVAKAKT
jgi:hypothetical protein